MKRRVLLILAWILWFQAYAWAKPDVAAWFAPEGNGTFSAAAQNVCHRSHAASGAEIWSPNHTWKIVTRPSLDGDTTLFAVDQAGHEFAIEAAGWPCPEIAWSPTSTLFFVTYSDGGAVGTYHVSPYQVSQRGLTKLALTAAVRRDFQKHYPKCFSPEESNIAGVAWSTDSTKLLVAAEVLPHSNCDNMGTFNLYAVAVSNGSIVERIPQLTAKTSFYGVLGQELRAADDSCFSQAETCWIPALHQVRKIR
jgi:hypothetical protein